MEYMSINLECDPIEAVKSLKSFRGVLTEFASGIISVEQKLNRSDPVSLIFSGYRTYRASGQVVGELKPILLVSTFNPINGKGNNPSAFQIKVTHPGEDKALIARGYTDLGNNSEASTYRLIDRNYEVPLGAAITLLAIVHSINIEELPVDPYKTTKRSIY